jgi:hypothetical protein
MGLLLRVLLLNYSQIKDLLSSSFSVKPAELMDITSYRSKSMVWEGGFAPPSRPSIGKHFVAGMIQICAG